jgi:hypothetical protein
MPPCAAKSLALSPSSVLFGSSIRSVRAFPFRQPTNQRANGSQLTPCLSITSALSIRRRMRILSEHRESKDPISKRSPTTDLLAQQAFLTLVLPITSALFASFKAHKQYIKTFLFFYFRTLVTKHPGGTIDFSPNSRFWLRKYPRLLFFLRALCVSPSSVFICKLSAVGRQLPASCIFLPASSVKPPAPRSKSFRICTYKSVTKQRTLSLAESTLTKKPEVGSALSCISTPLFPHLLASPPRSSDCGSRLPYPRRFEHELRREPFLLHISSAINTLRHVPVSKCLGSPP